MIYSTVVSYWRTGIQDVALRVTFLLTVFDSSTFDSGYWKRHQRVHECNYSVLLMGKLYPLAYNYKIKFIHSKLTNISSLYFLDHSRIIVDYYPVLIVKFLNLLNLNFFFFFLNNHGFLYPLLFFHERILMPFHRLNNFSKQI